MQSKFFLFGVAGSFLQAQAAPVVAAPKYLITFGDSYSQTGFDINGAAPSSTNPIGNPTFPGWTASGGIGWVGSLAAEVNTSLTLSYNFASGGATVDPSIVAPYQSDVVGMDKQVDILLNFVSAQGANVPWTQSNALVGVWMGVNDVGNSFWYGNARDIVERSVARYFELLQKVYDTGLRKFALLSVPRPLAPATNLTPLMLQQGSESNALLVTAIELFNNALSTGLESFKSANPDVIGTIVDTSLAFNTAIDNPTEYGAPDATCYNSDGVSCLWFNDYHPGIAIERMVALDVGKAVGGADWKW